MKLERIAVGVDFSRQCEQALTHARRLARRFGAELLLVHVSPNGRTGLAAELARRHRESHLEVSEARRELRRLASENRNADIPARAEVVSGDPETGLAAAADELGADLLIVGTHGRTGLRRFLLGSVAERTVRLAHAPVLVGRGRPGGERGYHRVLVPTDFSPTAEHALEAAVSLAGDGARIDVLHCWELPVPLTANDVSAGGLIEPLQHETREEVLRSGDRLIRRVDAGGADLAFHERVRPAIQGIQEMLGERDYDLVAMGSHGHRGLRRWLLGSVAEVTVRHASCATLVVKA